MRRRTIAAAAALIAATTVAMSLASLAPVSSAPALTDHLPNLRTRKPAYLTIRYESGRKLLRFTNMIVNAGNGPLDVRPVNDLSGTTAAYQNIFTHDAFGNWIKTSERFVGTFVFHVEHDHWHFEDFAEYALHRRASDGSVGSVISGHQDKVSFCMADSQAVLRSLAHFSSRAAYPTSCSQNAVQGISVGWGDRYNWRLAGQWVDVTNIPDGTYWLVSTADPVNRLLETNENDNRYAVRIRISGSNVSIV